MEFLTMSETAAFLFRKKTVYWSLRHLSLHLCLKSTTRRNLISVAVETQISDPQRCIVLPLTTPPIKGTDYY